MSILFLEIILFLLIKENKNERYNEKIKQIKNGSMNNIDIGKKKYLINLSGNTS